ncbi:MAG: very short patch repair endonuclease [Dehalococcoidia bacterium]
MPRNAEPPRLIPPSEARSRNMAAIRSRDTRPEVTVRSAVHRAGFRFSLHRRTLPGRPDLVLARYGVAVLVHGCFWHGHSCPDGHLPRTNVAYWGPKIAGNMARDARNVEALKALGWDVIVIHECSLGRELKKLLTKLKAKRRRLQDLAAG